MKQYDTTGESVPSAQKRDNHFSKEMWINTALQYKVAIKRLSDKSQDLIIDSAWKIAQERKAAGRATSSNVLDARMLKADERELLIEGDKDIQDDEIDWEACESLYRPSQTFSN